ncbi:sensor domain-containing diguanylate cyclase [Thiomicrorhabdus sp. Kp2]|uniref:sensor domain-containing diguanylate cyclase n=1 Tax=Thiomicrorhabdus sp. Kp2 TaxID=1123518 RepID=UPI000406EAB6|nr:sensor domain-containing diguanylate cyclase [Thiomicrorhabdus sp. Kp2]
MNFIKEMIGISVIEGLEIQSNNEYLMLQKPFFESEFNDWLQRFNFEQSNSKQLFREDFYTLFVAAELNEDFYSAMYNQTLDWYRAGLSHNRVMLILSNCRQVFILLAERKDNPLLAKGLCHIVDLVQSVVNSVFQLRETLNNMKKRSELEVDRMRRSFQLIAAEAPKELLQAFIDHQNWKISAYSAALGDIPQGNFPFSTSACQLGKWLESGGINSIPQEERPAFIQAHEKVHSLGFMALKEAKAHHPEKILDFLFEMENASDSVCNVLLERIDEAFVKAATMDSLTGLANRCAFDAQLKQNIALSKRHNFWLGLIVIDIDFFKSLNDNHGHAYGDQALKEVAQVLSQSIRTEDDVYRWGGEEFAVLTVDKEPTGIRILAERIRASVAEHPFCATTENLAKLTISLGSVAFHPMVDKTPNEIFALVDEQLYLAKQNGRNRVNARTLEAD